jgi:hypothetical protein
MLQCKTTASPAPTEGPSELKPGVPEAHPVYCLEEIREDVNEFRYMQVSLSVICII